MINKYIEDNLYELYGFLVESQIVDYYEEDGFMGVFHKSSAWPYATICNNAALPKPEYLKIIRGLMQKGYPSLLITGENTGKVSADLTTISFRQISVWSNMYYTISNDEYNPIYDIRKIEDTNIEDWIGVVSNTLFGNKQVDKDIFIRCLQTKKVKLFCTYIEDKPVSTLMVYLGKFPGLYMVATDKDFRKKGIAADLVKNTMNVLKDEGYDTVVLHSTNEGYLFYKSLGFHTTGELNLYYFMNKKSING